MSTDNFPLYSCNKQLDVPWAAYKSVQAVSLKIVGEVNAFGQWTLRCRTFHPLDLAIGPLETKLICDGEICTEPIFGDNQRERACLAAAHWIDWFIWDCGGEVTRSTLHLFNTEFARAIHGLGEDQLLAETTIFVGTSELLST